MLVRKSVVAWARVVCITVLLNCTFTTCAFCLNVHGVYWLTALLQLLRSVLLVTSENIVCLILLACILPRNSG